MHRNKKQDTKIDSILICFLNARVAELVDAADSKSATCKGVKVRFLSRARLLPISRADVFARICRLFLVLGRVEPVITINCLYSITCLYLPFSLFPMTFLQILVKWLVNLVKVTKKVTNDIHYIVTNHWKLHLQIACRDRSRPVPT